MTTEHILKIIEEVDLSKGACLRDGTSYLVEWKDPRLDFPCEFIILTNPLGHKVGGILNIGSSDIHMVVCPAFRGQHFMSNFFRSGILHEVWPKCYCASIISDDVNSSKDYYTRIHLLELAGLKISNFESVMDSIRFYEDLEEHERKVAHGDFD